MFCIAALEETDSRVKFNSDMMIDLNGWNDCLERRSLANSSI